MNQRIKKIGGIVGLLFLLSGCAAWQVSPEHTYLKALKHFNNTLEIYIDHYDLQTLETQAKWHKNIDPLIQTSNTALDVWGTMINDSQAQINYQKAFSTLVQALLNIGIVEVKEK